MEQLDHIAMHKTIPRNPVRTRQTICLYVLQRLASVCCLEWVAQLSIEGQQPSKDLALMGLAIYDRISQVKDALKPMVSKGKYMELKKYEQESAAEMRKSLTFLLHDIKTAVSCESLSSICIIKCDWQT